MTLPMRQYRTSIAAALSLVSAFAVTRTASAEITLLEKDGWTFSTDGRVNGFYSYETVTTNRRCPTERRAITALLKPRLEALPTMPPMVRSSAPRASIPATWGASLDSPSRSRSASR